MLTLPAPSLRAPPLQEDGSVVVPEALRLYMMGIDVIRPKKKINKAA